MEKGSKGTGGKATQKRNYLDKHQRDAILASLPAHIWIQAKDKTVLYSNRPSFQSQLDCPKKRFCHQLYMGKSKSCDCCLTDRLFSTMCPEKCECMRQVEGKLYYIYHFPFIDVDGSFKVIKFEIDPATRAHDERENDIWGGVTRQRPQHPKFLREFIRICSGCKKVLNEQGEWQQVEVYIGKHYDVDFSHGICPKCAKKLYPQFFLEENQH